MCKRPERVVRHPVVDVVADGLGHVALFAFVCLLCLLFVCCLIVCTVCIAYCVYCAYCTYCVCCAYCAYCSCVVVGPPSLPPALLEQATCLHNHSEPPLSVCTSRSACKKVCGCVFIVSLFVGCLIVLIVLIVFVVLIVSGFNGCLICLLVLLDTTYCQLSAWRCCSFSCLPIFGDGSGHVLLYCSLSATCVIVFVET